MPFEDAEYAVQFILDHFYDAPYWPQLPRGGLDEQMEIQYSEGLPGVVIDRVNGRIYFNTADDISDELGQFYEQYMTAMDAESGTGDCSALAITPARSRGLYAFERSLKARNSKVPFVKLQITGPITFALTVTDEAKRAIYYNEQFRDMIVKAITMKARWQIQKFAPYGEKVICFVDEPILSAFGSSTYVTVQRSEVVAILSEVIAAIHQDHALAGIHCCGNTEWSILVDAGVDILSFDAFEFGETLAIYAEAMQRFLGKGGIIAWGISPTSNKIHTQTTDSLVEKLEGLMKHLAATGIDFQTIINQSIITPSCGTGTLSPSDAEKVIKMMNEVAAVMKQKYGA
jgi:methionine synthase II (cobalamin-independent)